MNARDTAPEAPTHAASSHAQEADPALAPEALNERTRLTREPLPASRKVYVEGSHPGVRVPMREVSLTNGESVTLYDCSGPYTDP